MKIFISESEEKIIRDIFKKYKLDSDIYVFGSRARGDHKKYSDLDICLKGKTKIDPEILLNLKNEFQDSDLPFTVDIVDWNDISEKFQKNIKNDLTPFGNPEKTKEGG